MTAPKPRQPYDALARKIARRLFTFSGTKQESASRLVMEFKNRHKLNGPGWCEQAVIDEIREALNNAMKNREL